MRALWQDLRYGGRVLAKNPGFAAMAVITLALGIGANTAIFSLLDTLFLRSLPVRDPSALVNVFQRRSDRAGYFPLSFLDYRYYRERSQVFSDLAAHYSSAPINLVTAGESREINGAVVTANYFRLLGIRPFLGRVFLPEEDQVPGRNPVAVVSHDLWRRQLGGDPQLIGKVLRLNGTAFTVVGVAPPGFHGVFLAGLSTEVWMPAAMFRVGYRYCDVSERDCTIVALIGRLKPGRTPQDAQQELNVLARQLEASYPDTNQGVGVVVLPARGAHPGEREENGRTPVLLAAAVGLVLLIACANVAGLLLARTLSRRKEIAVRLALGAGRRRLVRQLLTESLLLSLAGGGAGLMVAFWVKDLLLTYYTVNSEGQRAYFNLDLDLPVLACTLAVSLVTSVVFGLAPAIRASCPDVVPALKDDSWSGPRRSRVRDGLVVAQIAVSLVLLIGAGLLIRSVAGVYRGPGFDSGHVVLLRLRPSLVAQSPEKAKSFQQEVIRRVKALPGIVEASPAFFPPLPGWDGNDIPVWLPGQAPPASRDGYRAAYNFVGPGYFATLGVTLLDGRDFTAADRKGTPAVVIINETLAHHFWPGASAIGRTLVMGEQPCEIIGVVKTVQYRSAADQPRPFVYADFWQYSSIDTEAVDSRTHVRVVGDAAAMLPLIRREIAAVDPDVPISEDRPLTEWLDYTFRPVRAAGTLLGCFSALALLLSAIGLYAVLSSSVSQQTREIAIRMALGAERSDVARLVMRRGASLALVGVASGLVAGLASGTLVRSLLYGVGQTDAVAVSTAAAVLLAAALLACYLPARRAMRVDPMVVLRGE